MARLRLLGALGIAVGIGAVAAVALLREEPRQGPTAPSGEEAPHEEAAVEAKSRAPKRRQGGLDVTFFVASDTHLGYETPDRKKAEILADPIGIEKTNLKMIAAMNALPGKAYPKPLGAIVGTPKGVLISGDLTEDGGEQDWPMFEALYGLTGKEGPLEYPVFEGAGNHDRNRNWIVRERVAQRHGGRFYSFDFDDLHLVCLGEAPNDEGIRFLEKDLAGIEKDVPTVLYFHYPLQGAWSENNWFGKSNLRQRLMKTIFGWNVIGIFHGHNHASGAYRYEGHDVYNVGSPKHSYHSFAAVNVTDTHMRVASYNYDVDAFWWWHKKPIRDHAAGDDAEVVGVSTRLDTRVRPGVDL